MFTLPQKEKWIIVGCGPSAPRSLDFIKENNCGVIALNTSISSLERADVAIFMHYEPIILMVDHFDKAGKVFIPDPCPVGRDYFMDADKLYWQVILDLPNVGLYHRCDDKSLITRENDSLYNYLTVATCGLSLLFKNGINKVYTAGVGDNTCEVSGYDFDFCKYPKIMAKQQEMKYYDPIEEEFRQSCNFWNIEWERI